MIIYTFAYLVFLKQTGEQIKQRNWNGFAYSGSQQPFGTHHQRLVVHPVTTVHEQLTK